MPALFSADHWRARAEEMLMLAEEMHDPICQRMMRDLAMDYEKLAERTEWLNKTSE